MIKALLTDIEISKLKTREQRLIQKSHYSSRRSKMSPVDRRLTTDERVIG